MAVYKIEHVQLVWETSNWTVEAPSSDEAEELFDEGAAKLVYQQIGDSVGDAEVTIELEVKS